MHTPTSKPRPNPYPFGSSLKTRAFSAGSGFRFGFNGKEKQGDIVGEMFDLGERELIACLGKILCIAPKYKEYSWQSPDAYDKNSPTGVIDYNGLGKESTHTDKDGNVVAVYNDGANGVYRHNNITKGKNLSQVSLSKSDDHAFKMGETQYWDEFIDPDDGKTKGVIKFNQSWETTLFNYHNEAMKMDLNEIGDNSKLGKQFDLKSNIFLNPEGPMTGRMLEGKYATARSARNYLAGWNCKTSSYFGLHLNQFQYMNLAGSLQQKKYNGIVTAFDIILFGKSFGVAPYYGEINYSGRMIINGWNSTIN